MNKVKEMRYVSQAKILTMETFRSSLESLPKDNRWVILGDTLPWAAIEKVYNKKLKNQKRGAGNKPARVVVGAMIVKHKMNLSDAETIEAIRENPYMQYMLGLSEYTNAPVFDPSLFVTIRERLQIEDMNEFSRFLMDKLSELEARRKAKTEEEARKKAEEEGGKKAEAQDPGNHSDSQSSGVTPTPKPVPEDKVETTDSEGRKHKGFMKIDATCSDAEVRYPTDVDLLNDGSRVVNRYIAKFVNAFGLPMPAVHFKQSREAYLGLIKFKRKTRKMIDGCKEKMLACLSKDLRTLLALIATMDYTCINIFRRDELRTLRAAITMLHQQDYMFGNGLKSCQDRIISIFQPHVRPIVRGKSKSPTEFGAKISVSVVDGFTFIDRHSWDAYNECGDLAPQVELYKERFGYLPSRIYADKIYMNRENRDTMKGLGIEAMGKPLGRPPKEIDPELKAKMANAAGVRNEVEGTFGTGKRVYRANNIRAKLPKTANCWTGMCYFVKNLAKFLKGLCRALTIWAHFLQFFQTKTNIEQIRLRNFVYACT